MTPRAFKFTFPCMRCRESIGEFYLLDLGVMIKCPHCGYERIESYADFVKRLEIAARRLKTHYEKEVAEIENLISELKKFL